MEYTEMLFSELRSIYFALAFLAITAVAVLTVIAISSITFYKDLKGYAKAKKKKKSISSRKKSFISFCAASSILLIISILGIVSLSRDASDLKYDIDNEAIVVSAERFTLTMDSYYPYKSKTRQDYYITIGENSEELRVKERLINDLGLREGEYTEYTVVYGESSGLILDIYKTKH